MYYGSGTAMLTYREPMTSHSLGEHRAAGGRLGCHLDSVMS